MPLVALPTQIIEMPVADRVFGATVIKQKARYQKLIIGDENGTTTVQLLVKVTQYAFDAETGGYGAQLPVDFPERLITLLADNDTAVKPTDGTLLYIKMSNSAALNCLTGKLEEIPQTGGGTWRTYLAAKPEPLALQGDFFSLLRDTQPVLIAGLIRQHIQQADAMGKFA
jgi:hypothetical protein